MDALAEILAGRNGRLDEAALEIASLEYPDLDPRSALAKLDAFAAAVQPGLSGRRLIERMRVVLFDEGGLRGNEHDYYDPRNSYLNDVLARGLGIPITLSIIYLEVGRRVGMPVFGVGTPGHFLVGYDDGRTRTYLDPFHGGRELTARQCLELAEERSGLTVDPQVLRPVTNFEIAVRVLANLRGIFLRLQQFGKLVAVLDRLLAARPAWAEGYRERGMAQIRCRRFRHAKADLERYLLLAESPADRPAVQSTILDINRYLTLVN